MREPTYSWQDTRMSVRQRIAAALDAGLALGERLATVAPGMPEQAAYAAGWEDGWLAAEHKMAQSWRQVAAAVRLRAGQPSHAELARRAETAWRWAVSPPTPPSTPAAGNGCGDGNCRNGQATSTAVAGLAREVEALRRGVAELRDLPRRVEQLAAMVARLAEQAAAPGDDAADGTVTWLDLPDDNAPPSTNGRAVVEAELVLARLVEWMGRVYLRYADAARSLPACWLWHPEVVEELVWLRQAWLAAYADLEAPVSLAGDWHDRQRPSVARRIRDYAGTCSIEAHQPDGERRVPAPAVPLADAAGAVASWWATDRAGLAPIPTPEQVAAAVPSRPARGRR